MSPSAEPASGQAEVATHLVPANLLGDGEIVILALKPSNWFVPVVSLPMVASLGFVAAAMYIFSRYYPRAPQHVVYFFAAAGALARLAVGCWQWLGRTYVLTSHRVVCIRGLVRPSVAAADLTDIGEIVLAPSVVERPIGVGSLYCFASAAGEAPERLSAGAAAVAWRTIAQPGEVRDILEEAVRRAHRGAARRRP